MLRYLIITESPKKAKTIKRILKSKNYLVISSRGHIVDLPKNSFGVYINKKSQVFIKYIPIKKNFLNYLKKLKNKFAEIIIATDPDREGEFISWSIVNFAKLSKYSRVRFYEITKKEILRKLKNKEGINENLVNAQKARRVLDRIIGYTLSPILWKEKIGESAGRVQSSALRLIVEREDEIKNFIPEIFYKLELDFGDFKAYLVKNKKSLFQKDKLNLLEAIKEEIEGENFVLKNIIKKEKIIKKPTPIDTVLLQRIAFLKYRFPVSFTMKLAQSLYEKGLITYHRTDSFNLSSEFLLKVKEYIKDYFENPRRSKNKFSQEAHEAIRPVYLTKDIKLDSLEEKLYKLIFDFTLSACSKNAITEEIFYLLSPIKNKSLNFEAKGEKLVFEGFLKFYPFKISFKQLPQLEKGALLKPKQIRILEIKTKPPSRYTESTLIKKLKELGIGRPSTYAEIIKTLLKRKYVIKEKGYLKPTEKGILLIKFLKERFKEIVDLKFTANMEEYLDKIARGEQDYQKYIVDFWNFLKSLL